MPLKSTLFCVILIFKCVLVPEAFLVVPEDVGTAFAAIYGFSPRIVLGRDHRWGWGFRLGSHADLQLLYELGPQTSTRSLQPTAKVRSAPAPAAARARRRPVLELLLRAGLLLAPAPRQPPASPPPPAPREGRETNAQLG